MEIPNLAPRIERRKRKKLSTKRRKRTKIKRRMRMIKLVLKKKSLDQKENHPSLDIPGKNMPV